MLGWGPIEYLRWKSNQFFQEWCNSIQGYSGIDPEYVNSGGIYLARTRGEFATLLAQESIWQEQGIRFERLSTNSLLEQIPLIHDLTYNHPENPNPSPLPSSAWFLPDEHQIRNPRYLQGLIQANRSLGVTMIEHAEVTRIQPASSSKCNFHAHQPITRIDQATIDSSTAEFQIDTIDNRYFAEHVCLATGAWTKHVYSLLQTTRTIENPSQILDQERSPDIYPVRGQMVLYKLPSRRYLVPRTDGYVLAGSCEEEVGFNNRTSPEMIEDLHRWANGICAELKVERIEKTWAGLRPATIDGIPYIGALDNKARITIAAGHYRHGIHLSPVTAKVIVDLLSGHAPSIQTEPFSLFRGGKTGTPLSN
jgi:glycine oxidase